MRVGVIGVGAIGGTIAGLLAKAGHSVEVTAHARHLDGIADRGLRLSGAFGDYTARVAVSETLTVVPDLAFVATKAQDAGTALADNAARLRGVPVVVVQNGLESVRNAKLASPGSDIVGGLALYAASLVSPGEIVVTTDGSTYLGGDLLPTLHASRVLGAVMPVTVTDNFEGAQWTKLIVNHVNALPAITGLSVQEVIARRDLRLLMTESMREAVRVGRAAGVRFEPVQGLSNSLLSLLESAPPSIGQLLPLLMKRRMGGRPNPGSTLQSIRRGQPTEIDYLNGAIVRRGAALGVPTPVSSEIVRMVHEVEASATFITPSTVVQRARSTRG
jgi:2-dehydropantoate 2-reductase